jgi:hypothetical protein
VLSFRLLIKLKDSFLAYPHILILCLPLTLPLPRFERLPCMHKGTYADDCLISRVTQHKAFIVATCDKDLKRRIRKIPGVPIMFLSNHRYTIERMPDAYGAPGGESGKRRAPKNSS